MKIYLAKSNKANPYDLMLVKNYITNKGNEVVEYTGGQFTMKPMDDCDYMIVIPDFSSIKLDGSTNVLNENRPIVIGKGLYGSIQYFASLKKKSGIFIYAGNSHMGRLDVLGDANEDDYINHSTLTIRNVIKFESMVEAVEFFEKPKEVKI